jgi:hypothetical protein
MLAQLFALFRQTARVHQVRRFEEKLAQLTSRANGLPEGPERNAAFEQLEEARVTLTRLRSTLATHNQLSRQMGANANLTSIAENLEHKCETKA